MTITDQIAANDPTYGISDVTVSQLKKALIVQNQMQTISDAISADVTNNLNVQWDNGFWVKNGDALYLFVKNTLGYSTSQMNTLIALAGTQAQ